MVEIHALQIGKVETSKVSLGVDDCIMIFDFLKDFYKDLGILFTDF